MKSNRGQNKFWQTKEFKKLNDKWYTKLKKSGFQDVENFNGSLKEPDTRTNAYATRRETLAFYQKLSTWLQTAKISKEHRKILELYCQGIQITSKDRIVNNTVIPAKPSIATITGWSDRGIRGVIYKYKRLI